MSFTIVAVLPGVLAVASLLGAAVLWATSGELHDESPEEKALEAERRAGRRQWALVLLTIGLGVVAYYAWALLSLSESVQRSGHL